MTNDELVTKHEAVPKRDWLNQSSFLRGGNGFEEAGFQST
jgi:hypothetical protein